MQQKPSFPIAQLLDERLLHPLRQIPKPPKKLWIRGHLPPAGHKLITIVGSRSCSQYGKEVVSEMCAALKGHPVSIISGLALGIDGHAHECALKNKLHTIAVVGSGLRDEVIYPYQHRQLATRILEAGGALVSENDPNAESKFWMFPARNRIMVGLSELVIIIEARQKSGTLITARLATDYNRDLLVVPNSIYTSHSKGSNELIKQGAYVYTGPSDLLHLLGFDVQDEQGVLRYDLAEHEKVVFDAITAGHITTQDIIDQCSRHLTISQTIQALLNLELEGQVKRIDGTYVAS